MRTSAKIVFTLLAGCAGLLQPLAVTAEPAKTGVVIMHGKGSSPDKGVADLASALKKKGYLVANLEMPWSGRREYDAPVSVAEDEVVRALAELRAQGAQKLFVGGHSMGGAFTLYFAGKHAVDGIICIAPGGNVGNKTFRNKLGASVTRARQLVADGKGDQKTGLDDFEGSKGTTTIRTTPTIYLTWFEPEGAMNTERSAQALKPEVPVLWLVAQRDYPGLRKANIPLFESFPRNPHTRLVEPDSDHHGAPRAAADEIMRWLAEVTGDR